MKVQPEKPAPVSRQRVIAAIYELASRDGRWPSVLDLASYLEETPETIGEHLKHLKRMRLFQDRQRQRRRVWMPWGQT